MAEPKKEFVSTHLSEIKRLAADIRRIASNAWMYNQQIQAEKWEKVFGLIKQIVKEEEAASELYMKEQQETQAATGQMVGDLVKGVLDGKIEIKE